MGVTSRIIAQLGMNHGMNVYVLSQGRKIAQFKHGKRGNRACLCFTADSDHAWFYETATFEAPTVSQKRRLSCKTSRARALSTVPGENGAPTSKNRAILARTTSSMPGRRTWTTTYPPKKKLRGRPARLRLYMCRCISITSKRNRPSRTPCFVGATSCPTLAMTFHIVARAFRHTHTP